MVLDTPDEQSFDDLVFVAAKACGVPIALITLLDTDRQWFKAKYGLDVCETDIEHSVCRIDIDKGDLLAACRTFLAIGDNPSAGL